MLHFNTKSWHYKLVLYVFGKNFFLERDTIDYEATHKANKIKWITKPKVINFCPYCRGVLWSAMSLPFVYIWRKLPHKEKKELSHEEVMKRLKRRGFIMRSIGSSIMFVIGGVNLVIGEFWVGITDIIIGGMIFLAFAVLPNYPEQVKKFIVAPLEKYLLPSIKVFVNFIKKHWPKRPRKVHKVKNPNIVKTYIQTYFQTKHSIICPPVCFIDKVDQENLR